MQTIVYEYNYKYVTDARNPHVDELFALKSGNKENHFGQHF